MLCYVLLCRVTLRYVMLCYVVLRYVMCCHVVLRYVTLRHVMLCYVMSRHLMLRYVMLCCYVALRHVTLRRYVMLCYVMFIISPAHLLFDWQPSSSFSAGTVVVVWVVLFSSILALQQKKSRKIQIRRLQVCQACQW